MPQQQTIASVSGPGEPWSNDFGTFHPYTLRVAGTDQPIVVNRKPDSPPLEVGQQVWLETKPGRNGELRGKIVQPPDQPQQRPQQQRLAAGDDPTRHSIEAQVATKCAVEFLRDKQGATVEMVGECAKGLYAAMQEMQR